MNIQKDGGMAFPIVGMSQHSGQGIMSVFNSGMTLRQYYKAAALQGMLSDPELGGSIASVVSSAARYADAMIAEDQEHAK